MFDERSVFHNSAYLWIAHNGDGDVRWEYRPRSERWNPLRYEIGLRTNKQRGPRFWINKRAHWHRRLSNLLWRLRHDD